MRRVRAERQEGKGEEIEPSNPNRRDFVGVKEVLNLGKELVGRGEQNEASVAILANDEGMKSRRGERDDLAPDGIHVVEKVAELGGVLEDEMVKGLEFVFGNGLEIE